MQSIDCPIGIGGSEVEDAGSRVESVCVVCMK